MGDKGEFVMIVVQFCNIIALFPGLPPHLQFKNRLGISLGLILYVTYVHV